jgi:hypothetical protein
MLNDCEKIRQQIAISLAEGLAPEMQASLNSHVEACPACASELQAYREVFSGMRSIEDEEAPRHFFVYPEDRRPSRWAFFRRMQPGWQAFAVCIMGFAVLMPALALSRLHIRSGNGVLTVAFGEPALSSPQPAPPAPDLSALEARILKAVEEKNRKDSLEWVRTLRSEIARSQKNFTPQQRVFLEAAVASVESRLRNRIEDTARLVIDRNESSIAAVYDAVSLQRDRDLAMVNNRFNRLTVNNELKSDQTNAILETLLQVAELKGR